MTRSNLWRWISFVGSILVSVPFQFVYTQEMQDDLVPKSNLTVMEESIRQLTIGMLERVHLPSGESIAIECGARPESWIVQQSVGAGVADRHLIPFAHVDSISSTEYTLSIPSSQLGVRYVNPFKDGILGRKWVEREISVQFAHELRNQSTNEILSSGILARSTRDTVAVDELSRLENESLEITHSELPAAEFLDRFIEPFVIIGATGVAIFLLFHIRS